METVKVDGGYVVTLKTRYEETPIEIERYVDEEAEKRLIDKLNKDLSDEIIKNR